MIKKIEIKKLFGRFNYNIIFKDNKLSILTGPNGYGKSTILKIIEAFNKLNIAYFNTIDFEEISIILNDNNDRFNIRKCTNGIKINNADFHINKKYSKDIVLDNKYFRNYIFDEERYVYKINKFFDEKYIKYQNTDLDKESYIDIILSQYKKSKGKKIKIFNVATKLKESVENVYFIKEQRLLRSYNNYDRNKVINVVEELPEKFKRIVSQLSDVYSQKATKLDSTYPERLFATKIGITEEEYKREIKDMEIKFNKIKEYDISDISVLSNVRFNKEHSKALKIYFEDFNEKYKVYEEYITMFDLYTEILNERLSFKRIKISKEGGFSVYDIDNENKYLSLTELSSGEKQEILLFFELIFDIPKNTLLLIDEPEISLHISWQKKFIDDLLRIIEKKNFKVIIATHSPQIISNHWDRQIDLGELYAE